MQRQLRSGGEVQRRIGFLTLAAGLALAVGPAGAQVRVLQAEADGDGSASGDQYAPVNFTTSTTLVSGGITYHALSGLPASGGTVLSAHASGVRSNMTTYAGGMISDIYCQTAVAFLNTIPVLQLSGGTGGAYVMRPPAANTDKIRIVNNSWVGSSYHPSSYDIRGYDYWIARDDLLVFNGTVNGGGTPMVWGMRNGIAVRGSQGFVTTGQSLRLHADFFGPESAAASNTTPMAAGMAAKIVGQAMAAGNADAQHHEVVKSILMTGTSKTAFNSIFTAWNPTLPNNLDVVAGAGITLPSLVDPIYAAGEKALTPLSSQAPGTVISAPAVTSSSRGWSYLPSIGENQQVALVFQQPTSFSNITATLAWDVVPPLVTVGSLTGIDGGADQLANLNLRLYQVNTDGSSYTLGNAVTLSGLASASTNDNVEHLYYNGAALNAGSYAFVIEYADTPNLDGYLTDAGFAYSVTMTPEPGVPMLGLATLGLAARRRRCTPAN